MQEITIYHNNRCSKSRAGLQYLEEKGLKINVVRYMDEGISPQELAEVLAKLHMRPLELARTKEDLFREQYKDKNLSDAEWIEVLAANPKLIERPIVVLGEKAVLARPTEKIEELLA